MKNKIMRTICIVLMIIPLFDRPVGIQAQGVSSLENQTWVRLGGPLGGLGYDIRMMPDNPDNMLVSDAWAGVFASKNGGADWQPSNDGISARTGPTGDAIPIFCLTIDSAHPNIVWAGTQNKRGIYKSTDGGVTWTEKVKGILEIEGITFRGITVDPSNSDIVYAAAEISSIVWNNSQYLAGREFEMVGGVVYKTTDGGEHWKESWRGDSLARYIWIDPRDTNVLYVSTGIFDREAANSNPQTGDPGGEGIIKSTDGGKTWTHINNGLKNLFIGTLFMHPTNPDILIAGAGNIQYRDGSGIYLTTDGGMNWIEKRATGVETINSVEISTSDPNIAYAAGENSVFRSVDGGQSWELVSGGGNVGWGPPGMRVGFPIDLQVDTRDPNRIFANAYIGGNFLSEDGGRTWLDSSRGYTGAQVRALAVDPIVPGRVYAAARSGIFVSHDGGTNWTGLNHPPVANLEWNAVSIDPAYPQHILAEDNWGRHIVSTVDGGFNWEQVLEINGRAGFHAIAFAPSDPKIVYAGSSGFFSAGSFDLGESAYGIFTSRNGGVDWLPANDSLSSDAHVVWLAVDPHDPDIVYAATANHGLLKTIDGGENWQAVNGGLPTTSATAVAIHPTDPNIIFAGFFRQALFMSVDGGQNWQRSSKGLIPEAYITSIVFDPTNPSEVVYIADNFSGVYRSADGGKNWTVINNGLSSRAIGALAISSDGLHLYAASEGNGVFRMDLNGESPAPAPIAIPPTATIQPTLPPNAAVDAVESQFAIDGKGDDWTDIPIRGTDPAGDQPGGTPDLGELRAINDAQYFYLYIKLHQAGTTDHYDLIMDVDGGEFDYQLSFWPDQNNAVFAEFPVTGNMQPLDGVTAAQGEVIEIKMPLSALGGQPVNKFFIGVFLGDKNGDMSDEMIVDILMDEPPPPTLTPTTVPESSSNSPFPCGGAAIAPLMFGLMLMRKKPAA
jgi:photosystem II stability/assembly factor-like uncharacterized protein